MLWLRLMLLIRPRQRRRDNSVILAVCCHCDGLSTERAWCLRRGNEHDFDGADASLEESGADGIGTYAEEQGVAGKPGCGGHG